jgi:hypothetical protein
MDLTEGRLFLLLIIIHPLNFDKRPECWRLLYNIMTHIQASMFVKKLIVPNRVSAAGIVAVKLLIIFDLRITI